MNERISLLEGRPFYFKILVLIVLILFGMSLVGGLGYFTVSNMFGLSPEDIADGLNGGNSKVPAEAMRILQAFFSLGMFLLPALAYAQISKENETQFFGFNKKIPLNALLLVFFLMIAISPFIDGLVYINYNFPYPDFMSGFMDRLIAQQQTLSEQMEGLTEMEGTGAFLSNLLIIALIPAIGEEWLFRGVVQKLFKEHFGKKHASIWLTAFFFAVLHQSVFYLLGLWTLGALLGYLKEWSGNIWLPVLAHFINNASILVVTYIAPDYIGQFDDISFEWLPFVLSTIVSGLITWGIYKQLKLFNSNSSPVQKATEEV